MFHTLIFAAHPETQMLLLRRRCSSGCTHYITWGKPLIVRACRALTYMKYGCPGARVAHPMIQVNIYILTQHSRVTKRDP